MIFLEIIYPCRDLPPLRPGDIRGQEEPHDGGQVTPWSTGSKQTVSVRRAQISISAGQCFSRKNRKHGETERALWELMGGGVRFSESDQRGTTGGLMSYISISFFAVLSGFWSDRSLRERERIGPTWLQGLARAGGDCNLNTVLMIRPRPCSRYLTWIPELFIPMIQITSSHLTCCLSQSETISLSLEFSIFFFLSQTFENITPYNAKKG